jgi:hypothetical protein
VKRKGSLETNWNRRNSFQSFELRSINGMIDGCGWLMRCHVASLSLFPPSSASLHGIPRSPCPLAQPALLLEPFSSPFKLFLQNLALNSRKTSRLAVASHSCKPLHCATNCFLKPQVSSSVLKPLCSSCCPSVRSQAAYIKVPASYINLKPPQDTVYYPLGPVHFVWAMRPVSDSKLQ